MVLTLTKFFLLNYFLPFTNYAGIRLSVEPFRLRDPPRKNTSSVVVFIFTDARACSRFSQCRISVPTSLTLSLNFDVYHVFERQMEISVVCKRRETTRRVQMLCPTHKPRWYGSTYDYRCTIKTCPEKIYESWRCACIDRANHNTLLLLALQTFCTLFRTGPGRT